MFIILQNGETLKNTDTSEGRTKGIESGYIVPKVPTGLVSHLSGKEGEI